MFGTDFLNLSLSLQASLASGFLAYVTAYAGFRREHSAQDSAFITLAFSSVAQLVFILIDPCWGSLVACLSALATSLAAAIVWRKWARTAWLWLMGKAKVHRDDGAHGTWSAIVQANRGVEQLSVQTKSGRTLYLSDRSAYAAAPWSGVYLGGDGGVILVVDEEELPDGSLEKRSGVADEDWGTRMTYIPASEVARVNIRMK